MPQSLADQICEYWKGPDAVLGREFQYFIPAKQPPVLTDEVNFFGCRIVASPNLDRGEVLVVAESGSHVVTFRLPDDAEDMPADHQRHVAGMIAHQIQIGLERLIADNLVVRPPQRVEFYNQSMGVPWEEARRSTAIELIHGRTRPKPWAPVAGLKTIFHPRGRFLAPDGRRFDYLFPEFMRYPDIPRALIPKLSQLQNGGARFSDRMGRGRTPINQWEDWE